MEIDAPEAPVRPHTQVIIVGGGPAGLATAACLKRRGIKSIILEKSATIGDSWATRYDSLHLHTHRMFSALPHLSFPKGTPRYPSRDQVARYLQMYVKEFRLEPRLNQEVRQARLREDRMWEVATADQILYAPFVVMATGFSRVPNLPAWPGMDSFPGPTIHSAAFTNGEAYKGQNVLVVGFGNSAGEIALDLHNHGAQVQMAVRGAVNVVPRDTMGSSTLALNTMLSWLPARLVDGVAAPIQALTMGDLTQFGLRKNPLGPLTQLKEEGRVAFIDTGTMAHIKSGAIKIQDGIERIDGAAVTFKNGEQKSFDAIILGTGFRHDGAELVEDANHLLNERGEFPSGVPTDKPGLYFCGFNNAPGGLLVKISREAKQIAKTLSRHAQEFERLRRIRREAATA